MSADYSFWAQPRTDKDGRALKVRTIAFGVWVTTSRSSSEVRRFRGRKLPRVQWLEGEALKRKASCFVDSGVSGNVTLRHQCLASGFGGVGLVSQPQTSRGRSRKAPLPPDSVAAAVIAKTRHGFLLLLLPADTFPWTDAEAMHNLCISHRWLGLRPHPMHDPKSYP